MYMYIYIYIIHTYIHIYLQQNCRVRAVSANSAALFGLTPQQMLGRALPGFFLERERVDAAVAMSDLSLTNPVPWLSAVCVCLICLPYMSALWVTARDY